MKTRNEGADLLLERRWEMQRERESLLRRAKDAERVIASAVESAAKMADKEAELAKFLKQAGLTDADIQEFDDHVQAQLVAAEISRQTEQKTTAYVEKGMPNFPSPMFPSGRQIRTRHDDMPMEAVSSR